MYLGESLDLGGDFVAVSKIGSPSEPASSSSWVSDTVTVKNYAFRKDWLEKRGLSLERLRVLRIKGDGMDPIFRDGDLVLVDNGIDTVEDGAPYVLWIMDKTVVRTLRHDGPDHWIVSHANKVYPDLRVEKSTPVTKFEVTGRVVASMQEW